MTATAHGGSAGAVTLTGSDVTGPQDVADLDGLDTSCRTCLALADGSGAFLLDDGTFIDIAMVRAAERVLAATAAVDAR